MKKIIILLFACACVVSSSAPAQAEVKLLRHPSYHNGKVAFSYQGDIWTANEDGTNVQRLTVNPAHDVYPRFSPDGKWIAFSSNRHGNYDVYVIPSTGGAPRQLTFHSANDTVVGWTPDSKHVIFNSSRGLMYPGIPNLYEVPAEGGLEKPLPTDWGYWGSFSPDGSKFAFNRHPMVWWRQHYRGAYAADLWVLDLASKRYTKYSGGQDDYKGNWFWPMIAANGDIYFVSDRLPNEKNVKPGSREVLKSANNIWKLTPGSGKPVQVTHFTDGKLYFPSISSDGKTIVYEENFGLWKLDTATGRTSEIKLNIASDEQENNVEIITVRNETDGYDLSPSGKRAAITTHGEIFTVATDRGDVQRVTNSFSRETQPAWSPDGKWIAFVSDKSGQDEVWIAHEDGTGLKKISDGPTEKSNLRWSPDSKALVYSTSDHKLNRVDAETGTTKTLGTNAASTFLGTQFSPDGKWLAYSRMDNDLRPHVFVIPANGGEEHHVGNDDQLFAETNPVWTPDGKRLLFLAGLDQQGSATLRRPTLQLYSVALTKEEKNIADRGVDSEDEAQAAERLTRQRGSEARAAAMGEQAHVEVKIEFDGIERRSRQITRLTDNVSSSAVAPDSRTYAFVATTQEDGRPTPVVYTVAEDGSQLTRLTQPAPRRDDEEEAPAAGGGGQGGINTLKFARDGRTLYYHEGRGLYSVAVPASNTSTTASPAAATATTGQAAGTAGRAMPRRINFTARVDVDHEAERKQVFEESWRIMKNRFYDADMHGADWTKARATYGPMMEYVADQEDMHDLISEMIGEMNASHTGISAQPTPEQRDHATQTRFPGFEMEPADGYYKVSYIYRNGPADKDYVNIDAGNYILAIDGHELKAGDNYWKYLGQPRGQKIDFLVNSKPAMEGAWHAHVTPVNQQAYTTLQYERWVDQRRAIVDKLSNGEIGYLHIRSMDEPSFRKFMRDLVDNHDKKALIIDQRFNPGGGIDQELLEVLSQRQYQKTRGRGSVEISRPEQAFFGPMVVMENERSTSDAEVFPDGFRTLGLGKVVGVTTYGAVIGTGAYSLLDGSTIRTPATGLWNVKGYNLENYGVPPDVYVDNTPDDFLAGRDAQIEKAIEVLKQQIKEKEGGVKTAATTAGK